MSDNPPASSREPTAEERVEQALLGALLIDNSLLFACERLEEGHFANEYHRALFRTLRLMVERDELVTMRTIRPYLDEDSPAYLAGLVAAGALPTPESVRGHANAVIDAWRRRRLDEISTDVAHWSKLPSPDRNVDEVIAAMQEALDEIASTGPGGASQQMIGAALEDGLDDADARFKSDSGLFGLSTGLHDFDEATGGLAPGNLIVCAGRPGMGKSALALHIATHVARAGASAVFFSLEMTATQLGQRFLAAAANLRYHDIGRGRFTLEDFGRMHTAAIANKGVPLLIDETPGLSVESIRSRARSVCRNSPVNLIVVDHLGRIRRPRTVNDVEAIGDITTALAGLAKELECPVLLLAQLNREAERRDDKRPMVADLRASGRIEEDADVIALMYREHFYRPEPPEDPEKRARWYANRGIAEIRIGKNRHGQQNVTVRVLYDPSTGHFANLARSGDAQEEAPL